MLDSRPSRDFAVSLFSPPPLPPRFLCFAASTLLSLDSFVDSSVGDKSVDLPSQNNRDAKRDGGSRWKFICGAAFRAGTRSTIFIGASASHPGCTGWIRCMYDRYIRPREGTRAAKCTPSFSPLAPLLSRFIRHNDDYRKSALRVHHARTYV